MASKRLLIKQCIGEEAVTAAGGWMREEGPKASEFSCYSARCRLSTLLRATVQDLHAKINAHILLCTFAPMTWIPRVVSRAVVTCRHPYRAYTRTHPYAHVHTHNTSLGPWAAVVKSKEAEVAASVPRQSTGVELRGDFGSEAQGTK